MPIASELTEAFAVLRISWGMEANIAEAASKPETSESPQDATANHFNNQQSTVDIRQSHRESRKQSRDPNSHRAYKINEAVVI